MELMLKKILPFLIILVIGVPIALLVRFYSDKEITVYHTGAVDLIPEDAYWIVESRSFPDLLGGLAEADPLFPTLELFGGARPWLESLRRIDSLIEKNSRIRQVWAQSPAVVSLHQVGKNVYQMLMVLEKKGTTGVNGLGDLFAQLSGSQGQWSERIYNDQTIYRINFGINSLIPGISLAEVGDFLIVSPSPILLENAVRQKSVGRGFSGSPAYRDLSVTRNDNALAYMYVNLRTLPRWIGSILNPADRKRLEGFTRYGDWAVLDLNLRNDALWLTGFALKGDTLDSYLGVFRRQLPLKLAAEQFLPAQTAAYYTIGIEKADYYLRDLQDYMAGTDQGRRRSSRLESANLLAREDVAKAWASLGFSELTIGFLTGAATDNVESVVLVSLSNRNETLNKLLDWLDLQGPGGGSRSRAQRKTYKVDPEHEYSVYPMPFDYLPEILGGNFFAGLKGRYFSLSGSTLILADNPSVLEDVLHFQATGRILASDPFYLSVSDLISTRSNATFFAVPHKVRPLLSKILGEKTLASLASEQDFLLKTGAVCIQFHNRDNMFLHNIFARFTGIELNKPQTVWESRLETPVASQPVIVRNASTEAAEVLVQDQANSLYLLNSAGRILWKKNIGEALNSEIYQVDLLRNARLQYLFSTASAIHALDRNGSYLPGFPKALESQATAGLTVVDYDGNRDYRLFIPCSDRTVRCFDRSGNAAKGWTFKESTGNVNHPLRHYKIQNKDYLVFADDSQLYILDRKGAKKVDYTQTILVSSNNPPVYDMSATGNGSRFLLTDVDGTVWSFYLDGTVKALELEKFSEGHYFIADDLNQDGIEEYIFFDKNRLEIYKESGEKSQSRRFDNHLAYPPGIVEVSSRDHRIGLVFEGKKEITLLMPDGTPCDGFPVRGATPFKVTDLGTHEDFLNLLVGGSEPYLYNYAIK